MKSHLKGPLIAATTLAVALFGAASAIASEVTQFEIEPATASRAAVVSELQRAHSGGDLLRPSALHGSFDAASTSSRNREEVRGEARREARTGRQAARYIGS